MTTEQRLGPYLRAHRVIDSVREEFYVIEQMYNAAIRRGWEGALDWRTQW